MWWLLVPVRHARQIPALAAVFIIPKYAPEPGFRGFLSTIMGGSAWPAATGLVWLLMRAARGGTRDAAPGPHSRNHERRDGWGT